MNILLHVINKLRLVVKRVGLGVVPHVREPGKFLSVFHQGLVPFHLFLVSAFEELSREAKLETKAWNLLG